MLSSKFSSTGIKPEDYITDQLWYKSKDGTEIPMFVTRKKSVLPSLDARPTQPVLTKLYAYGGFGKATQPGFDPNSMILMNDLNGIHVVASIRGGGEFGEEWH